jgi:hypothetical protein
MISFEIFAEIDRIPQRARIFGSALYCRKSRRSRQFPSALGILKRQSKNSATRNAGKMKKKANSLACQTCQLRVR